MKKPRPMSYDEARRLGLQHGLDGDKNALVPCSWCGKPARKTRWNRSLKTSMGIVSPLGAGWHFEDHDRLTYYWLCCRCATIHRLMQAMRS